MVAFANMFATNGSNVAHCTINSIKAIGSTIRVAEATAIIHAT